MYQYPISKPHPDCAHENKVNLERPDQEWPHSPLVPVVRVVSIRPGREDRVKQGSDLLPYSWLLLWAIKTHPVVVTPFRSPVSAHTAHHKAYRCCNCRGEDEARGAAENATGD